LTSCKWEPLNSLHHLFHSPLMYKVNHFKGHFAV
jgi:hypothetical protein